MISFSPRSRKFIALGLLIYFAFFLWSIAILPIWRWSFASMDTLKDTLFAWERAQMAISASKGVSEERVAEIERIVADQLVRASNEAEATTQLQFVTDTLLRQQGMVLESIQAANFPPSGPLVRVGIELRASGTEEKVIRFLAAAEQSKPLLRIERLTLRGAGTHAETKPNPPPKVALEAVLSAYWRSLPQESREKSK